MSDVHASAGAAAIGSTAPGNYGAQPPTVTLAPLAVASAWNLQGEAARLAPIAREAFGVELPVVSNGAARSAQALALWLGPKSWLVVATAAPFTDLDARRAACNAAGGALFDLSASRVGWRVGGPRAATLLAQYCPLDFDGAAFPNGRCAQSVFGHVNALYTRGEDGAFGLWVARSFERDVWHALTAGAAALGYTIQPPVAP